MARPHQAEAVANSNETVGAREAYYGPADLKQHPVFCGDDRFFPGTYIQWFGGVLNIPYNLAILEEAAQPFSVSDSLETRAESLVPVFIEAGLRPAVHSDVKTEQGPQLKATDQGAVGCAYADKRQAISLLIAEDGPTLVADAAELRPELFQNPDNYNFAHGIVAAHGRLAERKGFLTTGRSVVLKAVSKGAEVALVDGEHIASDGIINLGRNTSFGSQAATKAGLPAYNHDSWAAQEAYGELGERCSFTDEQREIAELIDTIGTFHALGVENIAVRR